MEKWLSMKELVKQTRLAETTIRRYINLFQDFIVFKDFGKHKKYSLDTVDILKKISEHYTNNKNTDEIRYVIGSTRQQVITITTDDDQKDTTLTPANNHVEVLLQQNQMLIESLQTLVVNQQEEIQSLHTSIEHLKAEMETMKKKVQEKRKFWKFW